MVKCNANDQFCLLDFNGYGINNNSQEEIENIYFKRNAWHEYNGIHSITNQLACECFFLQLSVPRMYMYDYHSYQVYKVWANSVPSIRLP